MVIPWGMRAIALICIASCFVLRSAAVAEQVSISWQTTDKTVAADAENTTREGMATIPDGEKAHITSHIVHNFGPGSGTTGGNAYGTMTYKFDDGSGFDLRFVGIWNSITLRTAGIFTGGLSELRGDLQPDRLRPQHGCRGAEGAGVGRRADLAAPHHQSPRALPRPVPPRWLTLAGDPHVECLRFPRPGFQSENPRGHRIKIFLIL